MYADADVCPGVGYLPLESLEIGESAARLGSSRPLNGSRAIPGRMRGRAVARGLSCRRLCGGKVGRALHGAGAEGVPRSASTLWERQA